MEHDNDMNDDNETGMRMSLRQRPPRKVSDDSKFMDDFDPEKSKRKLKKKTPAGRQISAYDEYGNIRHNGRDICDCMDEMCPGCWYPCKRCLSTKCGLECRVNRKFFYENITFDGKDMTINNKQFPTK